MFVLSNFLWALTDLLDWFFSALIIVIFLRAILSWVNADPYNGLVRFIHAASEPFLKPFRSLLPPWRTGGIDFSPLLAFVAIKFIQTFLISTLRDIITRMK